MSEVDISREAVATWKDRYGVNPALWENITALRAALDAHAGVTVKPLVWVDENGDGVLTSRETGRLKRIFPQDGGGFLASSLATDLFKTAEAAIAAYQADHEEFVLRCIEPTTAPLAEVAMRERAAEVLYNLPTTDDCPDLSSAAIATIIRALPTTATHAELLAAAMQLPEVKALVGAAITVNEWLDSIGLVYDADLRDALAPFAREGE